MMINKIHVYSVMIICGIIWSLLQYYGIMKIPLVAIQQSHIANKSHADMVSLHGCGGDDASGKCKDVSRVERIKIMCSKVKVKDRIWRTEFLSSNDKYRVLYCPMFKVGSTAFLSLMYDQRNWRNARYMYHNKKKNIV